jgi:hypothetical protein
MGRLRVLALGCAAVLAVANEARAEFPYEPQGPPGAYAQYFLPPSAPRPGDLRGKLVWMYASTAEPGSPFAADARELGGVRGGHVVDADTSAEQAWHTTTGRPDVAIGVTDSGIEWQDDGAMRDLAFKTRISRGEAPRPQVDRATATVEGADCATFTGPGDDRNRDGVFNLLDYACDARVDPAPAKGVNADMLDPQDVLIAFTDGDDDDNNGYADDMVGWDFLDDDNDPYDDVRYGHGTGEAKDSTAEADNEGELGTCPNCTVVHLRVGTSFIADVNRFAEAVVYATDNDVLVVQDALGTLNKSAFALSAIKYAYDHGTTVIASAADEAAQHHNQPSSLPYSIVVNSVTHSDEADDLPGPSPVSYLQFNGCTNFSSRITLAIPSVSCSSDATGRGSGMAGLVYSAAINAVAAGRLQPHPTCRRPDGDPCVITPNEVRQLMASGTVGGTPVADDVNFAQTPNGTSTEATCRPPSPGCTDPFLSAPTTRLVSPPGTSYPARRGHDQFYGYGRVNMARAVSAVLPGGGGPARIPPEVEVVSPNWFDMVDPGAPELKVEGTVDNRGGGYTCSVYAAAGAYPGEDDFVALPSAHCDGTTVRTGAFSGELASVAMADLRALFPPDAGDFRGREPGTGPQPYGGRPNTEPYGFVVKAVVTATGPGGLAGQDRRQAYLHRDADMLPGFPRQLPGDGESSPVLADVDGDDANELVLANSDGVIHVFERGGGQSPGWPRTTKPVRPNHAGAPGLGPDAVDPGHEAVLGTPAVGDIDRDGTLEIVVADLDRHVYVFEHDGTRSLDLETNPRFAGIPAEPFANLRDGPRNRTQPGAIGSPVLADLDGRGGLEIVLASMDRHVYAWHADGRPVAGWPALVVDREKVATIDPVSHQVTFKGGEDSDDEQQGAIVDTPAVGDLTGDGRPEVVIGTNEEYDEPINAGGTDEALYAPLGAALAPGNGRLFALHPSGVADELRLDNSVYLPGWPFRVGILQRGLLPLVGEGITGSPVIGEVPCGGKAAGPRVGTIPAAGLPYIVEPDGVSCYGRANGRDRALPTSGGPAADPVFLAAVGHPAFATLEGQPAFLAPAAGVVRASDVVLPEYQGGRDYLVAWDTAAGQVAPGWPAQVNDLQFLTGPSIAELEPQNAGQEVVGGTAHDDLYGLTGRGTPIDAGWPKLTGDWTVTNPVTGTWGEDPQKVVVSATRSGRMLAYATGADGCAPADWPQFHHDPWNTGDARRDAVPPARPAGAALKNRTLRFTAPGDDLRCGAPAGYEVATAAEPITPQGFAGARRVRATGEGPLALEGRLRRYVAVRAVDEQGNVGLPAVVDRRGAVAPCDPRLRVVIKRARLTARRVQVRGRLVAKRCKGLPRVVRVAVARRAGKRCRFLRRNGELGRARSCRRPRRLPAKGLRRWRLTTAAVLPRGRYVVRAYAFSARARVTVRVK